MIDFLCITFEERLNLLPPFLFYLPSKKLRKHCVAEVVHELADPLVACVLCAREASAALAVDEAHDDALRQGERVVIRVHVRAVREHSQRVSGGRVVRIIISHDVSR